MNKYLNKAEKLLHRGLDQHIKLAVTGLSRSGKTAFISAIVNQLTHYCEGARLPFFEVAQSGRLIGVKVIPQVDLAIPTFAYQEAINTLTHTPTDWPASTDRLNTLRLAIKYKPAAGIRAKISDSSTLYIDLIDYPGEWLLDLPMLKEDYYSWSEQQFKLLQQAPRAQYSADFLTQLMALDLDAPCDESKLKSLASSYQTLLLQFKQQLHLSQLQPGRLLMPAELKDAPITLFFPIPARDRNQPVIEGSNLAQLLERFKHYQTQVIQPFYKDHFCRFDRQIILVDLLTALEAGPQVLNEQTQVITELLGYFDYGKNHFLKRLFTPSIDKLLFGANKSDHISFEHHKDLALLLSNLVKKAQNEIRYEGVTLETMAMSSVCATKGVKVTQGGEQLNCIYGREMKSNKTITYLPAQPPMRVLSEQQWPDEGFSFPNFYPLLDEQNQLHHIRLDHVLQFLLGDKLQ